MIECSIWLGIWAWLQVVLLKKVRGGVTKLSATQGEIVHPWIENESVWATIKDDLPYSPVIQLRKRYHEFSKRFNFFELKKAQISFRPTSNLLEHLLVSKDSPDPYFMVVKIFYNRPILYALFNG